MTVYELLQALSDLEPDMEVRLMTQPSWPFEWSIAGTWEPDPRGTDPCLEHEECDGEPCMERDTFTPTDPPEAGVVYLTEGRQIAYGTKAAWRG